MAENTYKKGISVLICTYNSENRLPQTLQYLIDQDFNALWEVIVVDNASTDNTSKIAHETWNRSIPNCQFKVLYEPKPGKANALNLGFENVQYSYVLICDDDNWLTKDYLKKSFNYMEKNTKVGVLGGKGEAVLETSAPKWFEEVKQKYAVGLQGRNGKLPKGGSVYGAGAVVRKKAFDELIKRNYQPILVGRKGKQLSSGTDNELCLALQVIGYEIHFNKDLVFRHFITTERLTNTYFQRLSYGMIESSFLLYSYVFVLRNIKMNYVNYWLVSCYLFVKQTLVFIKKNLKKQNAKSRLILWYRYQVFWRFFTSSKIFFNYWKSVSKLKKDIE